jgi:hypothetical protein
MNPDKIDWASYVGTMAAPHRLELNGELHSDVILRLERTQWCPVLWIFR